MSRGKDGLTGALREQLAKVGESRYEPMTPPEKALCNKLLNDGYLVMVSTRRYKMSLAGRTRLGRTAALDIPLELKRDVAAEIKMLLHAQRDAMRNLGEDTTKVKWCCAAHACGTYDAETFGILRALKVMGMGEIHPTLHETTSLDTWREELRCEVLEEEHFGGSNECDFCLDHWGKDGAGRSRRAG